MAPSSARHITLGTNATHHQNGALPSVIQATRSEIHANPRWFCTSGIRCRSAGTSGKVGFVFASAIKIPRISDFSSVRFLFRRVFRAFFAMMVFERIAATLVLKLLQAERRRMLLVIGHRLVRVAQSRQI